MTTLRVEMHQITKRYGDLTANDGIDLVVEPGTVHAIVGENGAGKSTLMNVLYGMVRPDLGSIDINGERVDLTGPHDAIRRGIGMVHQHFMLVPSLSVAENVIIGSAPTRGGLINRRQAREIVRRVSDEYGLQIDPDDRVGELPVGSQQRVEILKALYRGAELLILDEPTAVLTPQEAVELGRVMRQLTESGKSALFISHKLKEVMAVSDEITVMRRGRVTGRFSAGETDERALARTMVGREVMTTVAKAPAESGATVLEVRDLAANDDRGHQAVRGVSLSLCAGTITGIAGVEGNGQTELIECLAGLRPTLSGEVRLSGVEITGASPRRRRTLGMSHIPEDRLKRGLAPNRSVAENLVATTYRSASFTRFGVIRRAEVRSNAEEAIGRFGIAGRHDQPVAALSGGNMQKVVVARELAQDPDVVLIAQPTRGVDIGAIENIHREIVALRDRGAAVLLVSAELDEVMQLADDLYVMYEGRLVAQLDPTAVHENEIGMHMAGVTPGRSNAESMTGGDRAR
ncbi:ABC transporter ATP-binding protein [Nocardioides soli]|uniref:Simple sugar transport system ATP-binding protein n=1 Tax=Nocardioides soli TaxID=1036020 RepID=A0A7W4Z2Y0_9ACTN|nr:ABC transporter ATP-binding protein [Nocardioides soli]MBB3043100.1 simple sugar transport system ATP-binding protein [Nocardioides soli]